MLSDMESAVSYTWNAWNLCCMDYFGLVVIFRGACVPSAKYFKIFLFKNWDLRMICVCTFQVSSVPSSNCAEESYLLFVFGFWKAPDLSDDDANFELVILLTCIHLMLDTSLLLFLSKKGAWRSWEFIFSCHIVFVFLFMSFVDCVLGYKRIFYEIDVWLLWYE